MDLVDFIIGLTLMNAMPHYVLGVWNGRMISAFGFGNRQNMLYGLVNLAVSVGLFSYKVGLQHLPANGIYLGALALLAIYVLTGRFWYTRFNRPESPPASLASTATE